MKIKIYTILIVSKGAKAPKHFSFSQKSLYVISTLLLVVMVSGAAVVRSNRIMAHNLVRMPVIEQENKRLQGELARLEEEISVLDRQMGELDKLSQQVRGLTAEVIPGMANRSNLGRVVESAPDKMSALNSLQEEIPQRTEEMQKLLGDVTAYKQQLAQTPDFWPVQGRITSPYGWRQSPFSRQTIFHYGIDLGAPYGAVVRAAADGKVVCAQYQRGYGNLVIINHGKYLTYYAHLSRFKVAVGDQVKKGQAIAEVGSTGNSTGPHLHFEVHKDGLHIDPLTILK